MVFPLQYSTLKEAHPMWNIQSSSKQQEESPPGYTEVDYLENLANEIKPFDRLRIVDENLEIDRRFPLSFHRRQTGDSRKTTLEKLRTYPKTSSLMKIVEVLCTTTYKNDKDFIQEMGIYMYDIKNKK